MSAPSSNEAGQFRDDDFRKLLEDIERELLRGARSAAILGLTPIVPRILAALTPSGLVSSVGAIYAETGIGNEPPLIVPVRPIAELATASYDIIIVAADAEKEDLLWWALPYLQGLPKVILAGYAHHSFRDPTFGDLKQQLIVPSIANGYPNSLIHLYQCLENAARLRLEGAVAEFGAFQGGTTMFLARAIRRLGQDWPVLAFDTFEGFPTRKTPLDMYDNAECSRTSAADVRRYLAGEKVEIIEGDIAETVSRLRDVPLVLSFVDTDNYTPATAALKVIQETTVPGGAIVFDHFTGENRFRYTLGERMAARKLLSDPRYVNLHGTGVFFRQR